MFISKLKISNFLSFVGENVVTLQPFTVAMVGSQSGKSDFLKAVCFVLGHSSSDLGFNDVDGLYHKCLIPVEGRRWPDVEVAARIMQEPGNQESILELRRIVKGGVNQQMRKKSITYLIDGSEVTEQNYKTACHEMIWGPRPLDFSSVNFYNAIFNSEGIEEEIARFMGVNLYRNLFIKAVLNTDASEKSLQMYSDRLLLTTAKDIRKVDDTVDELEASLSLAEERSKLIFPRIYESRKGVRQGSSRDVESSDEQEASASSDETSSTSEENIQGDGGEAMQVVQGLNPSELSVMEQEVDLFADAPMTVSRRALEESASSDNVQPHSSQDDRFGAISATAWQSQSVLQNQEKILEEKLAAARQTEAELLGSIVHTQTKLAAAIGGPSEILRERAHNTDQLLKWKTRLEKVMGEISQELQLNDAEITKELAQVNSLLSKGPQQRLTEYGRMIDCLRPGEFVWLLEHVLGKELLYGHLINDDEGLAKAAKYAKTLRDCHIEGRVSFINMRSYSPKFKELLFEHGTDGIELETVNDVQKFFFDLLHVDLIDDVPILVMTGAADFETLTQGKRYIFLETRGFLDADGMLGRCEGSYEEAEEELTSEHISEINDLMKHQDALSARLQRMTHELLMVQQMISADLEDSFSVSLSRVSIRFNITGPISPRIQLQEVYDEYLPLFAEEDNRWQEIRRATDLTFDSLLAPPSPEAPTLKTLLQKYNDDLKQVQSIIKGLKSQLDAASGNLTAVYDAPLRPPAARRSIVTESVKDREQLALGQKIEVLRKLIGQDEIEISSCTKGREYRQSVIDIALYSKQAAQIEVKICAARERELEEKRQRFFLPTQRAIDKFGTELMEKFLGCQLPETAISLVWTRKLRPWRLMLTLGESFRDIEDHCVFIRCLAVLNFFLNLARERGGMLLMIDDFADLLPRTDADVAVALAQVHNRAAASLNCYSCIARIGKAIKEFIAEIDERVHTPPECKETYY